MNTLKKISVVFLLSLLAGCVAWKDSAGEVSSIGSSKSRVEFTEPNKDWRKHTSKINGADAYEYVFTSPSVDSIRITKIRYSDITEDDNTFRPDGDLFALANQFIEHEKELIAQTSPLRYELISQQQTTTQDGASAVALERIIVDSDGLKYRVNSLLIPMDSNYFYQFTYKAVNQYYYQQSIATFQSLLSSVRIINR
ncbi:hypothetical protein [Ostreibacterium oceani]|uniref:PsbP C-terminal domain-containing protein n=1 Tax=Ostreibacterium oceani TaxID=2654998 RepID=A0A6N7EUL1_9GAMM|nr:hypothetical protein [Ostreibacterium oceani]MPV85305.1 hypothetical protein [Ostreibacterium oceani]